MNEHPLFPCSVQATQPPRATSRRTKLPAGVLWSSVGVLSDRFRV